MKQSELLERVIRVIGKTGRDDWKIEPTEHAAVYRKKAPGLSAILESDSVIGRAEAYEKADQDAVEEQAMFKRTVRKASFSIFGVVILSSLLMGSGMLDAYFGFAGKTGDWQRTKWAFVSGSLGGLSVLIGALASHYLAAAQSAGFLAGWYKKRANAERFRHQYFFEVIQSNAENSSVVENLLKLEYMRRYLLDSQLLYYEKRGKEHLEGFRVTAGRVALAAVVATCATSLAGLFAASIGPQWAIISAVGAIAAGYAAMRRSSEEVEQNQRSATQYEKTAELLSELRTNQLKQVRHILVSGGDAKALEKFFYTVHKVLIEEHSFWLEGEEDRLRELNSLSRDLHLMKNGLTGDSV